MALAQVVCVFTTLLVVAAVCDGRVATRSVGQFANRATRQTSQFGLQDAFGPMFDMGVSIINPQVQLKGTLGAIVKKDFKIVVPENIMTWQYIQPKEGKFSWSKPDYLVKWAKQNNKTVIGHCLVWKEEGWIANTSDREVLLKRIEKHIKTVVGRYKGQIKGWNVINEAFADDGTIRTDFVIPKVLGAEYIVKAFLWAHEADPNAELYLNEYHMYLPHKATAVTEFVRSLRLQGIPIHGIGIQGHQYHIDNSTGGTARAPTIADFQDVLVKCNNIGVRCFITELDMTVLPNKWACCKGTKLSDYSPELQAEYNPYVNGMPLDVELKFNNRYRDFFAMLVANTGRVQEVQFWGLTDAWSWYNARPIRGRKDYPLLWDRQSKPKAAYNAVMSLRGL